jgi:hypothetical protein
MAFLLVGMHALAAWLAQRWKMEAPLSVAVIATAVIVFVGLLAVTQEKSGRWELTDAGMRTAIAGTIVLEYLVLVAIVAFFRPEMGTAQLPAISTTLVTNFTTIVGIVIAFYFGASAYVEAHRVTRQRDVRGEVTAD